MLIRDTTLMNGNRSPSPPFVKASFLRELLPWTSTILCSYRRYLLKRGNFPVVAYHMQFISVVLCGECVRKLPKFHRNNELLCIKSNHQKPIFTYYKYKIELGGNMRVILINRTVASLSTEVLELDSNEDGKLLDLLRGLWHRTSKL